MPVVIYLNADGGTFHPGADDARVGASSILAETAAVPAWTVSADDRRTVEDCIADELAPFGAEVTDVDPGDAPHDEIVLGGAPADLGMDPSWGGVSPFDCSVIPNAVVFDFAATWGRDLRGVCETAVQELAHAFGLDHEYLCADPMTYLGGCGDKTFQDVDAPCGEYAPRACRCGGSTQNSFELLTERMGADAAGGGCSTGGDGAGFLTLALIGLVVRSLRCGG